METEGIHRVGIMGGTFDPIHNGHLILAEHAYEQFHLEKVLFLPNGNPPHKRVQGDERASQDARLEMVRLAIQHNPHFELDAEEIHRSGYSYTKDTLKRMSEIYKNTVFYFIIGADSLMSFDQWCEPAEICRYCVLAAAVRNQLDRATMERQMNLLREKYHARIVMLETPDLDISSSFLRRQHAAGKSVRYYLPDTVYDYIKQSGLYLTDRNK